MYFSKFYDPKVAVSFRIINDFGEIKLKNVVIEILSGNELHLV